MRILNQNTSSVTETIVERGSNFQNSMPGKRNAIYIYVGSGQYPSSPVPVFYFPPITLHYYTPKVDTEGKANRRINLNQFVHGYRYRDKCFDKNSKRKKLFCINIVQLCLGIQSLEMSILIKLVIKIVQCDIDYYYIELLISFFL